MESRPLIDPEDARSREPNLVWLDARAGADARALYEQAHVSGAHYADLERDLSAPVIDARRGGRHPLPLLSDWCATLGRWGITPDTNVVVYDDAGGGMAAARAWWMLQAVGHRRAFVLNGGWAALVASGASVDSVPVEPAADNPSPYPTQVKDWPAVDQSHVADRSSGTVLIDARAAERYRGEVEPIDPVAGHIPGAVNLPWQTLISDGRMLPVDALKRRFAELFESAPNDEVICYCGSGVTACHLILAMTAAGLERPKLYVGSWSEWCRSDRPLAPSI